MPAYAPRHGDDFMVILDSNCFWIRGLRQYVLYSGDEATVRELLPSARKLMELLSSYANEDGLIESPPYPYWLDHAVQPNLSEATGRNADRISISFNFYQRRRGDSLENFRRNERVRADLKSLHSSKYQEQ